MRERVAPYKPRPESGLRRMRACVSVMTLLLVVPPGMARQAGGPGGLRIVVLTGAGATNVTQQIPAEPVTIRVEDANGRPVVGANVIFSAPETGPGGEFSNEINVIGVITGEDGLASAGPYHPNASEGSYQIEVRVEFQGQAVATAVEQRNIGPGGGSGRMFAILGIIGAAAGAAVAAALGGDDGPESTPPDISFTGGAVGAPAP